MFELKRKRRDRVREKKKNMRIIKRNCMFYMCHQKGKGNDGWSDELLAKEKN